MPDDSIAAGLFTTHTATDRNIADRAVPDLAAPDFTADRATPDRATPDRATPDRATPDRATPDRATPDRATPDRATPDRATPDRAAADEWLDHWTATVNAQAARAAELTRRLAALTGRAQTPDGSIRVTVGASGRLESLEIRDHPELPRRILSLLRRAQSHLAGRVAVAVQDTVGADTETGRSVIHSFETRFPCPQD